ncbi:growth hormone-regulated TBC protein 1-A-like isoform X3 [Ptychodera flava]|uniref:growth hormone-regulated TBC protein 1-A-like isoform X3 n=1 Tax=Ptychodera flava TaxID=63121 RepID=UPI00396A7269
MDAAKNPAAIDLRSAIDPYGFERPEDFDYQTYEEFMSHYLAVLARRAGKWSSLLSARTKVERSRKVKRYCRKGIPAEHRGMVWMHISGAQKKMEENPGLYEKLLNGPKDQRLIETISTDIHRTFPDNIYFKDGSDEGKRRPLYNVLVAYGHHNKGVGYCQGLNFITGLLLLVLKDEEMSFFLLDTLLDKILPDYYTQDMSGLKTDQEVLGELVKLKLPHLHAHVEREGVPWSLPTTKWFICLYLEVLPLETVLRIWDSLFYEGSKIIFRVALTLLGLHQDIILKATTFPNVVEAFKKIVTHSKNMDCHSFMQNIFKVPGSLPLAQLTKIRQTCRAKVV